ncbi:hypothetical protein Taro_007338 [Colocasia esculenta]|uniref:AB hydrolase-1 domain-containing protein n=1 Tax=Colocasia esculenta TaxID=4460 RepID=A0A843TR25_COLES|nr:hypothetical protein [Colocasia esculenta]
MTSSPTPSAPSVVVPQVASVVPRFRGLKSSPLPSPAGDLDGGGQRLRGGGGGEDTPPGASRTGEPAMVSLLKVLAYGVGGMAVAGVALLATFQERLVYVPVLPGLGRSYPFTPARLRLNYEDVWLRASDGVRLHAWFIKHQPERADIAHRLDFIRVMLQKLHCNVLMLSYRGYGASDGYPSQHGITMDAQAALDHLLQRSDIDTSRIVVFGRSLGGAVGSVVARNNPDKVSALILENTFTSILDMSGVVLPILKWFIGSSASKGPKIKPPIIFLSGLQDELVPPCHMRILHEKAVENNRECLFVDFPSGMHMDTWLSDEDRYWRAIQLFLDRFVPGKEESIVQSSDDSNDEDYDDDDDYDGALFAGSNCNAQKRKENLLVAPNSFP